MASPIPDLDVIYGHHFPVYDFSEDLKADDKLFIYKFDYIAMLSISRQS